MERLMCIHGHFYQPPRENPWLEEIEIQDSAYPYHDWNERIAAECYAPNSASRLLDGDGRIAEIVNNYSRISFDFGPTLLSWMQIHSPEAYEAILSADRQSAELWSGHGNAMAQVYNHIIMPLANSRDKRTQIKWGIKDFESRFKRFPEGMWLPETAVDSETLDILAECGIKFTILAQHQAARVRIIGKGRCKWKEVSGGGIDPTRPYLCVLPSGRKITVFFYDGPISKAVAFEEVLNKGEDFANRLVAGFSDRRQWDQILNIATDGESYGHHHKFGDMALAYAMHYMESKGLARFTNYGEYLEKHPPLLEVQIVEKTSWSCAHGVERWKSNCGCNTGSHSGWNQEWRSPLREAFDWLRDTISSHYEEKAKAYVRDPWMARDEYVEVILDRSRDRVESFVRNHAQRELADPEKTAVLELMELQRHAMLMYTSCGWFFDELSGIETVQVIQYAGRVVQLAEKVLGIPLEDPFKEKLSQAPSNLPEHRNGAHLYEKFVKPAMVDLEKVAAHYAISSLIKDYADVEKVYCYSIRKDDYQRIQSGEARLAIGRTVVTSDITSDSGTLSFCVLHLGGHDFNGGLRTYRDAEAYQSMKQEIVAVFEQGAVADIIRLMDKHFGMNSYSLANLFRDEQRKILALVTAKIMEEFEHAYRLLYENNRSLMNFLQETGIPVPKVFLSAAEFTLNHAMKKILSEEKTNGDIKGMLSEINKWNLSLDATGLEFMIRRKLEAMMGDLKREPAEFSLLSAVQSLMELLQSIPIEVNLWESQNSYFQISKLAYSEFLKKSKAGDDAAAKWVETFRAVGNKLFFNTSAILSEEAGSHNQ